MKGSGKTSVLECIRFSLGADVPQVKRDDVHNHLTNILGPSGKVRLLIKREDGTKLIVERRLSDPKFHVTFPDDRVESFSNPSAIYFPAYILGWHEIEQAATDSTIRQFYLDTIAGRDKVREIEEQVDADVRRIRHLHDVVANKDANFRALHEQVSRLEELKRGLQELTDQNLVEMRDQYQKAVSHREGLTELRRCLDQARADTGQKVEALLGGATATLIEGDSPVGAQLEGVRAKLRDVRTLMETMGSQHQQRIADVLAEMTSSEGKVEAAFTEFSNAHDVRMEALHPEKRGILESHQKVLEQTRALPRLQGELSAVRSEIDELLKELVELCERAASLLDARTKLREEKVTALNKDLRDFRVELAVEPMAERHKFDDASQKFSTGRRIFDEMDSRVGVSGRVHRKLAQAYRNLRGDLVGGYRLFFASAEFGHFVDIYENDDLKIRFSVGKKGEAFSPIDQLSAGQRCTAIFPLLLKLQEGPLVVDQPEDNLDNRYIAETISPALSRDKRSRQIVLTSHNANLVVLTDSEQIVAFEGKGAEGVLEARGFLATAKSSITGHVLSILDGGRRALELRYAKYGRD